MSEGSYEYEISRAELLGIEPPTYEDFLKNKPEQTTSSEQLEDEIETEMLNETENQNENNRGLGGKFDELNHILQGTQQKLNQFKNSYGSIRNILKIKMRRNSESMAGTSNENDVNKTDKINDETDGEINGSIIGDIDNNKLKLNTNQDNEKVTGCSNPIRKSELSRALDMQTSNLDDLAEKAQRAEISMREQTNQMKKVLNFNFFSSLTGGK